MRFDLKSIVRGIGFLTLAVVVGAGAVYAGSKASGGTTYTEKSESACELRNASEANHARGRRGRGCACDGAEAVAAAKKACCAEAAAKGEQCAASAAKKDKKACCVEAAAKGEQCAACAAKMREAAPAAAKGRVAQERDIVQATLADRSLRTFALAVHTAGLTELLRTQEDLTVFAPTNDAFAKMGGNAFGYLLEERDALRELLMNHVVTDKITSADIRNNAAVTSVSGHEFRFTRLGEAGGFALHGARILRSDVPAKNGVIHVVDTLIAPWQDALPADVADPGEVDVTAVAALSAGGGSRGGS